jgi:hypothetical protein
MSNEQTLVEPGYRPCSGRRKIDGITFKAYSTGPIRYALISEDGCISVTRNHNASTYRCRVLGHGAIIGAGGATPKRFTTQEAAMRAGIKLLKSITP